MTRQRVGEAIALILSSAVLAGCGSPDSPPETGSPSGAPASSPAWLTFLVPFWEPPRDPYAEAMTLAKATAEATQDAASEVAWEQVAADWGRAIALLEQVPANSPNEAAAQERLNTYRKAQEYALQNYTKQQGLRSQLYDRIRRDHGVPPSLLAVAPTTPEQIGQVLLIPATAWTALTEDGRAFLQRYAFDAGADRIYTLRQVAGAIGQFQPEAVVACFEPGDCGAVLVRSTEVVTISPTGEAQLLDNAPAEDPLEVDDTTDDAFEDEE